MKINIGKTVEDIQRYFPRDKAPMAEWEDCKSSEDFVRKFGDKFFLEFWPFVHDDSEITKFLLPYTMEYFITFTAPEGSSSDSADYFIGRLDPIAQKETHSDWYVERLFNDLTEEQRKTVCKWLVAMRERYDLLVNIDGAIAYWCGQRAKRPAM